MASQTSLTSAAIRHPDFLFDAGQWAEWRETFRGGEQYRDHFLKKWSDRETDPDFLIRKFCTPIPTFAKAAIIDIRNSIFQRLEDVIRNGGSTTYNKAIRGENAGVDRKGTSMNSFIGIELLTELLVMGRAGVYVDAPNIRPVTLAEESIEVNNGNLAPYLYTYRVEDILSCKIDFDERPGTFAAVLLRDHVIQYNTEFGGIELPEGRQTRLRLVWRDTDTGKVRVKMFKEFGSIDPNTGRQGSRDVIELEGADPDGAVTLDIEVVPFIMPSIGDSLMIDITSYQHALLNLVSGDVNWSIQSSSPFLTIQQDRRSAGAHLKKPNGPNSPEPGGQHASNSEETIGGKGRYYDLKEGMPQYIAPPTDPMLASMQLQEKLEDDIRKLVNLAVANKAGSRTESAEAKKLSSQGLEAGLSFIGLVLQDTEQLISDYWAMYDGGNRAVVSYPARYILKQDKERIEEANGLLDLMDRVPSKSARQRTASQVVQLLLGGREDSDTLTTIMREIASAGYTSGVVQDVLQAHGAGLVSDVKASDALGYDGTVEVKQAREDKAKRAALTLIAQQDPNAEGGAMERAGARGVPEIDPNESSAEEEKEESMEEEDDG